MLQFMKHTDYLTAECWMQKLINNHWRGSHKSLIHMLTHFFLKKCLTFFFWNTIQQWIIHGKTSHVHINIWAFISFKKKCWIYVHYSALGMVTKLTKIFFFFFFWPNQTKIFLMDTGFQMFRIYQFTIKLSK